MPGVRIRASSRGIRVGVGPRYARAHVGTRGAGVSIGPRVARGYVGTQGAFISSRVGPFQAGPRGASVSVGAGPASVWIGGGKPTVVVGGGSFWLGLPIGSNARSSGDRTAAFKPVYGDSNLRPRATDSYRQYQHDLKRAGVKRRNRSELRAAWLHSYILDLAPMMLVAQKYERPDLPVLPPVPSDLEFRSAAKNRLVASGESASVWLPGGRRAVAAEVDVIRAETLQQRRRMQTYLKQSYRLFSNLDTAMNLTILQAAFADNGGTAAPIAINDTTLTVLMSFPSPEESVWPEKATSRDDGGLTVKKRTKREMREVAEMQMRMHMISTAKEAFGIQPFLDRVQIVAVREDSDSSLGDLEVLGAAFFSSDDFDAVFPAEPNRALLAWRNLASLYQGGDVEVVAVRKWSKEVAAAVEYVQQAVLGLLGSMQIGGDTSLGKLRTVLDGVDFEAIEAPEGRFEAPSGSIADNPLALRFPEFWIAALASRADYLADLTDASTQAADGLGPTADESSEAKGPLTNTAAEIEEMHALLQASDDRMATASESNVGSRGRVSNRTFSGRQVALLVLGALAGLAALLFVISRLGSGPVEDAAPPPTVPDVQCMRLDNAINRMNSVGLYPSTLDDSGRDRRPWIDSNWIVVSQNPRPGTQIAPSRANETLRIRKDDEVESCVNATPAIDSDPVSIALSTAQIADSRATRLELEEMGRLIEQVVVNWNSELELTTCEITPDMFIDSFSSAARDSGRTSSVSDAYVWIAADYYAGAHWKEYVQLCGQ